MTKHIFPTQQSFNSAIRKLQESKDSEITRLKEEVVSRSMFVQSSSPMNNEGSPIDMPLVGAITRQPHRDVMATSGMSESVTNPTSSKKDQESVVISK